MFDIFLGTVSSYSTVWSQKGVIILNTELSSCYEETYEKIKLCLSFGNCLVPEGQWLLSLIQS